MANAMNAGEFYFSRGTEIELDEATFTLDNVEWTFYNATFTMEGASGEDPGCAHVSIESAVNQHGQEVGEASFSFGKTPKTLADDACLAAMAYANSSEWVKDSFYEAD